MPYITDTISNEPKSAVTADTSVEGFSSSIKIRTSAYQEGKAIIVKVVATATADETDISSARLSLFLTPAWEGGAIDLNAA
jgi:hypothetical protein